MDLIAINIYSLDKIYPVSISSNETIGELKQKLYDHFGPAPPNRSYRLTLLYNKQVLYNGNKICDYDIQNNDKVHICFSNIRTI